jgi:hypothetical protein
MAYRLQEERVGVLTLAESRSPLTSSWHLDVLGRDQAHGVAEPLELAADVVGASTGFHADQAGWLACKEGENLVPPQLLAK